MSGRIKRGSKVRILNHKRIQSSRLAACRVEQNPSCRAKFRNTPQLALGIGISRILHLLATQVAAAQQPPAI
jgi:hypothetical protein